MDPGKVLRDPGHLLIAGGKLRSIGQVEKTIGYPGTALDLARARSPNFLISGQDRLEIIRTRLGQEGRQCEGVLYGRVGALPVVGKHRVGRVAEQHLAAVVPTKQRTQNEEPPAHAVWHRVDHLRDSGVPTLEEADWLLVP